MDRDRVESLLRAAGETGHPLRWGRLSHRGVARLAHAEAITAVACPTYNRSAMLRLPMNLPAAAFGDEIARIFVRQKTREWEPDFYQVSPPQPDDMLTFL